MNIDTKCIAEQLHAMFNSDAAQMETEIITLQNDLMIYQAAPIFWCLVNTKKVQWRMHNIYEGL